jgi:3-hydroxyacyl-CoA dehydrogenase
MIHYELHDDIAVIGMNNPPVNALCHALRQGLLEAHAKAVADPGVKAIVISSDAAIFCGGADISEFSTGASMASPILPEVNGALDASAKLTVAAINGSALGGGFEVALGCDYRIAAPNAKIGLPEIHLGVLPGAGGTQRLPRVAGVAFAADVILGGKPVAADKAHAAGAIDRITEGDLLEDAIAYARELVAEGAPSRHCAELDVDTSELPENFFAELRQSIARKTRGFYAPERCIQCLEAACEMPLAEGLKRESELFVECAKTPQARAQQHLFFAERAAGKVPGVDSKTPLRDIQSVGIIGSGTMGGGIAMCFLNAGIPVIMLDLDGDALDRGVGVIRKNYEISAKKGRMSLRQVEERLGMLGTTTEYGELDDVDMVIEAVFEKMEVKYAVFRALDVVCKPGCILASNTSTLNIDEIAAVTSRPEDVIGMHFFSPANIMRLLEIVRCEKTADDVIVTCMKIAKQIRKVPVVVRVCFGFVGNRMVEPYTREATRLLLEGAAPAQIDKALTDFGMAMGPIAMGDLAGLDVGVFVRQSYPELTRGDAAYGAITNKLVALGRLGQKTGRGFYIYEGRDRHDDPEVLELAKEIAAEHGIEQREFSDQEIVERTIYPLIDEGARVLADGIAARSGDCDLVYANGYGFPWWRGGPMQFADEIGPEVVLDTMLRWRTTLGEYGETWFEPAALLEQVVAEGETFASFIPAA